MKRWNFFLWLQNRFLKSLLSFSILDSPIKGFALLKTKKISAMLQQQTKFLKQI